MNARDLVLLTIGVVAASQVPQLMPSLNAMTAEQVETVSSIEPERKTSSPLGSYVLESNRSGHFNGNFLLNGKSVAGMIDTGATFVAMNETTAKRLGFTGNSLDYRYAVNTANGPAEAAHVMLDRVEIGGVRAQSVEAFVLKDQALSETLIGMSFLRKLKSYAVENGRMVLKQ